jgi:CheY-like chemotaxis protein
MILSLENVVRSGSKKNDDSSSLSHEEERAANSAENNPTTKTVLFVDDETSILEMRRLIFASLGYSVLTALSGDEALNIVELHRVDAVVLDYLMPGMNGEETARCIRKLRRDIPLILSSGCLTLPESVLEVVTVAIEKAAGPQALIEVLEQQLHPSLDPAPSRNIQAGSHR